MTWFGFGRWVSLFFTLPYGFISLRSSRLPFFKFILSLWRLLITKHFLCYIHQTVGGALPGLLGNGTAGLKDLQLIPWQGEQHFLWETSLPRLLLCSPRSLTWFTTQVYNGNMESWKLILEQTRAEVSQILLLQMQDSEPWNCNKNPGKVFLPWWMKMTLCKWFSS